MKTFLYCDIMPNMNKVFLDRNFEFGGIIGKPYHNKGEYKGVYLVVRPDSFQNVVFKSNSDAFWFKGKNPTVSLDKLLDKWVDDAILYIGKHEKSVRKRMQEHIVFWKGNRATAWGGRVIAQIENYEELEMWYLPCDNPKQMERNLLDVFCGMHDKKLPFANFRR